MYSFWLGVRPDSWCLFCVPGKLLQQVFCLLRKQTPSWRISLSPTAGWTAPSHPLLLEHLPEMSSLLLLLSQGPVTLQELFPTLAPSDLLCMEVLVLLFLAQFLAP